MASDEAQPTLSEENHYIPSSRPRPGPTASIGNIDDVSTHCCCRIDHRVVTHSEICVGPGLRRDDVLIVLVRYVGQSFMQSSTHLEPFAAERPHRAAAFEAVVALLHGLRIGQRGQFATAGDQARQSR
jgi:hypothetical protein